MGRFAATAESQTAQAAGAPSGVTFNGYFFGIRSGASANFKLRRLIVGVRAGASVPTSQQMTLQVQRQTAAAVGTGITLATAGANMDPNGAGSAITGFDITTATAAGTTGVTLTTVLHKFSFNTQSMIDIPMEFLEELYAPTGVANGLALVNIGNALPAAHLFTVSAEWEE
jgi:hypothetical protein